MRRSSTSVWPASASVGSLPSATMEDPSTATLPTTRLVPPMSIPRTNRTRILRTREGGHRLGDKIYRQVPHAAVMPQRADLGTMAGAGAAGQVIDTEDDVALPPRTEAELGHGRPEE